MSTKGTGSVAGSSPQASITCLRNASRARRALLERNPASAHPHGKAQLKREVSAGRIRLPRLGQADQNGRAEAAGSARGHEMSVANRCIKVVDRLPAGNLYPRATDDLERIAQLRPGQHPGGAVSGDSDKSIHFNQFEDGTADRIRYKKVNERTGDEVPSDRITRLRPGRGEYVILTDEELKSAEPKKSRQIEISDFVGLVDIDPVFFRSSYYLAPEGEGADKAYALLRRAMNVAGRIGIATLVMRNKEYLVAIRPDGEALALHTMYFSDEVRQPGREIPELPSENDVTDRELSMAQLLIESMESDWDPEQFHDTHRKRSRPSSRRSGAGTRSSSRPDPSRPPRSST